MSERFFSSPSWISFFSCGICMARSRRAAVKAGLKENNQRHITKYKYGKVEIVMNKTIIFLKFYLRPVANMESNRSLTSLIMAGPTARASMLIQVKTDGSTTILFCFLWFIYWYQLHSNLISLMLNYRSKESCKGKIIYIVRKSSSIEYFTRLDILGW